MITVLYVLYGAPLELVIGGIYLYQFVPLPLYHLPLTALYLRSLMGWSAFVGIITLLAGWPLNSFITKRAFRIRKGLLSARDKRMGVLTELLGGVCILHACCRGS